MFRIRLLRLRWLAPSHAQARYQLLQTADEKIGLAVAFKQRVNRPIFAINLLAQKIALVFRLLNFPFQARNIARLVAGRWRFLWGVVAACRGLSWYVVASRR